MRIVELGRRRVFIIIASIGILLLIFNVFSLTGQDLAQVSILDLPDRPKPTTSSTGKIPEVDPTPEEIEIAELEEESQSSHPIAELRLDADRHWREYESEASSTFKQTVETYRRKYGRHPPPGFKTWYNFARERNVLNIDDFDQVMDDLRPFWAVEPHTIRQYAAHMSENPKDGISGLHIRDHKVARATNPGWRSETLQKLVEKFVEHLPEMDIAMNGLDQPRTVVPWEDMQSLLAEEYKKRVMPPMGVVDEFTAKQDGLLDITVKDPEDDTSERLNPEWFRRPGKQYMDVATLACPPESPARSNMSVQDADALYKHSLGGLVTNFNRSSDLCTVGPTIQDLHGFLHSSSSLTASKKLLPVFSECKVNVNSDILFPANKYSQRDIDYEYSPENDLGWEDKKDTVLWLGASSGGVQIAENWKNMHRQRLVQLLNGTYMAAEGKEVTVVAEAARSLKASDVDTTYENFHSFQPGQFAQQHNDVGFTDLWGCIPSDCPFYGDVFAIKPKITFSSQFRNKYLIDVDGHSFSGRWHAYLESKSLGFKATLFREWHDSRLFAWRHFVPVDNRYDDLYTSLTYFLGNGHPPDAGRGQADDNVNAQVYIPSHDMEGRKIALQGREWAKKVLRREDIEVYMFRLLLEYGRVIDDRRDHIGYSGDGSEADKYEDGAKEGSGSRWGLGKIFGNAKPQPPAKSK